MNRAFAVAAIALLSTIALGACNSSAETKPVVDIKDFAFSPDALEVKAGTKVTFTNRDGFDHTVTAKDGSFRSGSLAVDATFTRTFDAPGTYPYLCSIH